MKVERTKSRDVFAPPVSYAQERLWFLEQLEPGTPLYNIPYIATLKGAVHGDAFNRAVNRLIARHESLRTCFIETQGKPKQAIHERLTVEVDRENLGHLDARAAAERLQAICTEVTSTPFDLTRAPLFRMAVVSAARETTIITALHHIIADGWSLGVFQRELSALYQEELGGSPARLPELKIQYADYAAWQRERLQGGGLERLREYWLKQLDGAATILELPADKPRPLKQTFSGDVYLFDLPAELAAELRALSNRQGTTLFMTLYAAFAVLLYRLTGQKDVLVGTPIAGRRGAEVENLIGLFVNTLVLRARLEPELSFARVLADVKATVLESFEHQDMPFEKLVLELNPRRDLSHSPLIQVLFTLQNIPPLQALMGGGEAPSELSRGLDGHTGTSKFDCGFFVSEVRDGLQCSIEYNTDLFSAATIEAMGGYFVSLLRAIARDPQAKVSSHPLMDSAARQRCLENGRGPDRGGDARPGCHRLFERQCRSTPDAIAVSHTSGRATERMTYAQLNAYANRIARVLVAHGVRAGDNVALCTPRGVRQLATVLAIVKAGAAYVPLDPEYPPERLRFILGDARARVLVVAGEVRPALDGPVSLVVLEQEEERIASQAPEDLPGEDAPGAALYVIHTSGSTGRPKGVVMPHRAIANLVEWQARASSAEPDAVTLQYASLNFDVASQEIFSTLTSGGRLELVDESVRRDSPRLLELLGQAKVRRLFLPPVALEQLALAAAGREVALEALREVIVAGDKLQVTAAVRSFFARAPRARLVNQYGPTESHVVSAHALEGPAQGWPAHPPIGRPIDNVQLYVLDEAMEPVPPKVAGELYIGGQAIALGYLDRPEETGKRFVRNPFDPGAGPLYRTGDVCRYEGDGSLSFIGRADHQIKLRGFRIEPGEVEVALKAYPGVNDAVVVKRQSKKGEDQLAAYLVADEGAAVEKAALRDHLAGHLPAYMIPTHFIRLQSFPLTGSGKIDRLRLPEPPELEQARDGAPARVAPRNPVEQFLADCWSGVLQVGEVSIRDNFFDLGGHSLSATQVVSRIRDRFGLELPLYRVFERPTVESLALEIVQRQASQEEQPRLEDILRELESLSEEQSAQLLAGPRRDQGEAS